MEITAKKWWLKSPCEVVLVIPPDNLNIFTGEFPSGIHVKMAMDKFLQGDEVEEELPPECVFDWVYGFLPCIIGGLALWFML